MVVVHRYLKVGAQAGIQTSPIFLLSRPRLKRSQSSSVSNQAAVLGLTRAPAAARQKSGRA